MRHSLRLYPGSLLLILAIQTPFPAFGDDLDAFAARLLCEQAQCPSAPKPEASPPLVIEGITLPKDAARQRDNEQAFLVQQGAYLNDQGQVTPLTGPAATVSLPERGELSSRDHGPADLLPTSGPVLITTPRSSASP
ncbi:hypothetical protein [Halomonas mongoliensis]|uniref:hypothetical protein n=1 Tax=Halomonas mongoliensis TaxID=321265 RepID=UPI00403A9B08